MHGTLHRARGNPAALLRLAAKANAEARAAEEHHKQSKEHARRCGEALMRAKALVPHGEWGQWLRANFERAARTARLYMQMAQMPAEEWQRVADLPLRDVLGGALKNESSVEHYSPPEIIEAARRVFGGTIDLDPASCAEANRIVQATTYYTKEDDGLSKPWFGHAWMNQPYDGTSRWNDKLARDFAAGRVRAAVSLLNSFTFSSGSHRLVRDYLVCLPEQRLRFWGPGVGRSQPCPSALVYFGNDGAAFAREFEQFGAVLKRYRGAS
jgi:hypothetical protein